MLIQKFADIRTSADCHFSHSDHSRNVNSLIGEEASRRRRPLNSPNDCLYNAGVKFLTQCANKKRKCVPVLAIGKGINGSPIIMDNNRPKHHPLFDE